MNTPSGATAKPVPWNACAAFEPKKPLICITAGRTRERIELALSEVAALTGWAGTATGACAYDTIGHIQTSKYPKNRLIDIMIARSSRSHVQHALAQLED